MWIEGITQGRGADLPLSTRFLYDKVNQATLYQGGKYCDWGFRKSQLITPLAGQADGAPGEVR